MAALRGAAAPVFPGWRAYLCPAGVGVRLKPRRQAQFEGAPGGRQRGAGQRVQIVLIGNVVDACIQLEHVVYLVGGVGVVYQHRFQVVGFIHVTGIRIPLIDPLLFIFVFGTAVVGDPPAHFESVAHQAHAAIQVDRQLGLCTGAGKGERETPINTGGILPLVIQVERGGVVGIAQVVVQAVGGTQAGKIAAGIYPRLQLNAFSTLFIKLQHLEVDVTVNVILDAVAGSSSGVRPPCVHC